MGLSDALSDGADFIRHYTRGETWADGYDAATREAAEALAEACDALRLLPGLDLPPDAAPDGERLRRAGERVRAALDALARELPAPSPTAP